MCIFWLDIVKTILNINCDGVYRGEEASEPPVEEADTSLAWSHVADLINTLHLPAMVARIAQHYQNNVSSQQLNTPTLANLSQKFHTPVYNMYMRAYCRCFVCPSSRIFVHIFFWNIILKQQEVSTRNFVGR